MPFSSRFLRRAAAFAAVALVAAPPARAQTDFTWPQNHVDVGRYATVDQCLAMVSRVRDSATTPGVLAMTQQAADPRDLRDNPAAVREAARRCGTKWRADAASLNDFAPLLSLYLYADRADDAKTLVARRLATVPALDSARFAVLDTVAITYAQTFPIHPEDAERAIDAAAAIPRSTDRVFDRIAVLTILLTQFDALSDTAGTRRVAGKIMAIADSLTPADKRSRRWQEAKGSVFRALEQLSWFAGLDSLRHSTAGYAALRRATWARATEERIGAIRFPVGEAAKPIQGDFWFAPSGDTVGARSIPIAAQTRPTRGRVSLMVSLLKCLDMPIRCMDTYATLKRLHERFPDVELTVTTQTHGFFRDLEPPAPAAEAALYRQWWLEYQRLPVVLAVSNTPFWRLPAPDRRRIDEPVENVRNYAFGDAWAWSHAVGVLVDESGTIVDMSPVNRGTERRVWQLIDALMQRPRVAPARAERR